MIGGTRVARRAGTMLATSVTSVPTSMLTTIVRVARIVPDFGRSIPNATNSAFIPLAIPMPMNRPITEASRPTTRPSSTTERSTWRREAPSVRSVANSRERWATVMESVLTITNAPTNSARKPKPSSRYVMNFRPSLVSLASALACASPVLTSASRGTSGLISRTSAAGETPSFALTEMLSKRPVFSNRTWAVWRSKMASDAPPSESTEP